ncbi:MAG: isoprenylcysteine carboxylmethyltransferase family protein [Chitinophagaceae bacterium]|nr:isoprenylcysteine carboxylmethyltransferase family protein [Chitinophagaceae bacterium]MDP1763394.1 isoprenylcysteine carboxylmethyltransferase family protein [Sediminibacterium sp.]MDP1811883.1 isoprenylcysteine carboxylmethyltransferase family protein [Sediminibacterium sp.]MDP3128449.1 isoprenylcysteine carboxylmethyltransferase family protein [Sediminibacterium sp.]
MRKIFLASVSNILMIVLPLLGKPALMLNGKILFIIAGSICMWLTQPPVSVKETSDQKSSDRFSVVLILLMSLVSVVVPIVDWAYFSSDWNSVSMLTIVGACMIIAGISFRAWAVHSLGKYFTATVQIKEDHRLIKTGPYRIVRHPSYTGAFMAIIAGGVILGSLTGFIISCMAMIIAYYVRIGIEEKELIARFGDDYLAYKRDTKMMIPYVC